jgi:hypothetical protein
MPGRKAREFGLGPRSWAEKPEGEGRKAMAFRPWEFGLGPKSHGVSALGIRLGPKSQDRAEYPGPNCHLLRAECPFGRIDWVPLLGPSPTFGRGDTSFFKFYLSGINVNKMVTIKFLYVFYIILANI